MDKNCELSCRRNKVGGQAVIEGVMMKNGEEVCLAMRREDGRVDISKSKFVSVRKKHKWLNIPLLRGVIGFVESLILSFKTINKSTEVLELDEDKTEKDGKKKSSGGLSAILMIFSMIIGIGLAVLLFMWLPGTLTSLLERLTGELNIYLKAAIEGVLKIIIFIAYMLIVSLMKDIRRVFEYHGAEHKSIACFEAGMELTPENAKKCTRFHPRCGTSFMFVMLIIGIFSGMLIPVWDNMLLRAAIKLAILPLVVGIGYEFIMFAGKHDNLFTKIFSAPGLWMQRITTKEPDEKELAIAISAIKSSMPEEFPDFDPSEYDIDVEDNREHIGFTGMKKKDIEKRIEELKEKRRIALEEKAEENAVSDENADTSSAIFDAEAEESSENENK
ncbi:MAG: DUF1385 domain-containing protein [Clostridia bacterium]|nr:DUF1385 domain-containing protein [Clostridia bacterium]